MSSFQTPKRPSTIDTLTQELGELLAGMNVPEKRRAVHDIVNITWLVRKLKVGNPGHPNLERAMDLMRRISEYRATRAAYDSGRLSDRRSGYDRRAPKPGP